MITISAWWLGWCSITALYVLVLYLILRTKQRYDGPAAGYGIAMFAQGLVELCGAAIATVIYLIVWLLMVIFS